MIRIQNLAKRINNQSILRHIDFQVFKGELVTIIGPSGSGKTLLLECLTMNTLWHDGSYNLNGKDLTPNTYRAKRILKKEIAYLKDTLGLNPNKTSLQNVKDGVKEAKPIWGRLFGTSQDAHMEAMDILEKLGLLDLAHKKVNKLSGGEQQRVAIAKATAKGATIIIADEPVSGLDPLRARQVIEDFKNMTERANITLICTLHRLELAEKFADRIIGMKDGRIVVEAVGRRLTEEERNSIFD
ncbi:phosphonate ABC transporter ATP-binding protein [Marinicrinis lubricantis]|uniref:Phosphonate ABC transporter ATP-binding protein n=1 Tax=Marinicrinis lubricantis TaxID=2086470 RepID=A0ABW1IL96_9BACL